MKMRAVVAFILILVLLGCGKTKPAAERPPDRIIARVNGEPIYNKDVKMALALRLKDDPSFKVTPNTLKEQINMIINERLALQHKERSDSRIEILSK